MLAAERTPPTFGALSSIFDALELIVDAHRGRIEVQSEAGRGTRFRFSIPTA